MIDLDSLDATADTLTPTDDAPRKRTPVLDRLAKQHDRPAIDFTKHSGATPKMIGYVMVLLRKLDDHNPDVAATAREWWMSKATTDDAGRVIGSTLPFDKVSDVITRLKGHLDAPAVLATPMVDDTPNVSRSGAYAKLDAVPEGRYALPVLDDDGNPVGDQHRYFKIKLSKRSKKYVVEGHGGGNGDLSWGEMLRFDQGLTTIIDRIAADWVAAMLLFAEKTDRCGDCGRSLTNEESRRIKIGPYCRGKKIWAGMPWYNGKDDDDDVTTVDDTTPEPVTMTSGRMNHAHCTHPRTPAGRAACRAQRG